MRTFAAIVATAAVVASAVAHGAHVVEDSDQPALQQSHVDYINDLYARGAIKWQAAPSVRFSRATIAEAKRSMGTFMEGERVEATLAKLPKSTTPVLQSLPSSFDVREHWPVCAPITSTIYDQASCGSCWAVSSTSGFSDRTCIATNGKTSLILSTQQTTSCCNLFSGCFGSQGCIGGMPAEAWNYFVNTGVVTGGLYADNGKTDSCYPYQLPPCNHHVEGSYSHNCTEGGGTPACPNPKACTNKGYATSWEDDKHYAKSSYGFDSVEQIMSDIATYGSVTAAFTVYSDFLSYKSGVYHHVTGPALGGHAVRVIGWGEENGTPYWLIANSWNAEWGDKGLFKIVRGSNECGIESQMVAGHA